MTACSSGEITQKDFDDFNNYAWGQRTKTIGRPQYESTIEMVGLSPHQVRVRQQSEMPLYDCGIFAIGDKKVYMAVWFNGQSGPSDSYTVIYFSNFSGKVDKERFNIAYTGTEIELYRNDDFKFVMHPPVKK